MQLYSSNGTTLLASSSNTGNQQELINYYVYANTTYYIRINSASGSSSSQYFFRTKNYTEDRCYGIYNTTFAVEKENYMNCYGWALQIYSTSDDGSGFYKQQPGEFANDSQTFQELDCEMDCYLTYSSGENALNYLQSKIYADFDYLNSAFGSEWTISLSTQGASVPTGYRKIALTVRVGDDWDYHFYLRNGDGTWTHKPGSSNVRDYSFTSHVTITDDNIGSVITEGGYDDGVRYYLIKKPAVGDYPHQNGHDDNCTRTLASFIDKAGDRRFLSLPTSGDYTLALLNYEGDMDWFRFTPSVSGTYTITTSLTSSSYDVDIIIFDQSHNLVAIDQEVGNPIISVNLTANKRYYIWVQEYGGYPTYYNLYHYID